MSRFIEINSDTAINLASISRIERATESQTGVYIDDTYMLANLPYESLLGMLNLYNEPEQQRQPEDQSALEMVQGLYTEFGQAKP